MDNQLSLFECSVVDPALRDNRDAMAYPFLALQKQRTRPIEYNLNGVQVSVAADRRFSIATIWDWDVVILPHALDTAVTGWRAVISQKPTVFDMSSITASRRSFYKERF